MTKKKFLNELETRLSVLNEEEKQDIINEYKDIIEEKVRNGKSVLDAINDFGDIDELTVEILKAYKINPNYNQKDDEIDAYRAIEGGITKVANRLGQITKQLFKEIKNNYGNITVENVFEILIKFFILMVVLMILKIPFHILYNIGTVIFDFGYNPVGRIILLAWKVIVWTIYFIACGVLVLVFAHNQLENLNTDIPTKLKNKVPRSDKLSSKLSNEDNSEVIKEDEGRKTNKKDYGIFYTIRLLIGVLFIFPLILVNVGLYPTFVIVFYLILKGISIYGLLIVIIGFIVIFGNLYHILYNLIFSRKRIYTFPLIIGIVLVTIGGLLTIEYASELRYYNTLPNTNYNLKTETFKEKLTGDKIDYFVSNNANTTSNTNVIIDEELSDKEIVIEISYYDEYITVEKEYYPEDGDKIYININNHSNKGFREIASDVFKNLKNKEVYNYKSLFRTEIKIYANSKTMNQING